MNRLAYWLLCGITTILMTSNLMAVTVDVDDPAQVEAFFDGIILAQMKANNSPAGTVAITRHGEIIFAKGYGYQDLEKRIPVDPYTTLFRPGSVSKLFTWVAVMQLVEQGKLDLDTNVNEYLDSFQIKDTFERQVTLRDIMTHSAGFEDGSLGYLIVEDPKKTIPLAEAMERYEPLRVNPPGAQTAYSNYATSLAGLIVAETSGTSFQDYIKKNIFDPLDMDHSSFEEPLPENLAGDMAASYTVKAGAFEEKPFEIIANFAPAGSESATSTDMVKFAQAMLNGGELNGRRILKQETVEEMLSPQFSHDDRLLGMALGFYAGDYSGTRVMGHGGDTQYFHSFLGIDQEHDMTYFLSFAGPGGSPVRSVLMHAFYEEVFPRHEEPPVPPDDFSERAAKYAGNYGFWRNNFSTIEKALGLASSVQIAPTEDNTLVLIFSGKAKQYVEVENNLFRERNSEMTLVPGISPRLLAFQQNAEGQVTGFVMDGLPFMSLRKLSFYEVPNFNFMLLGLSLLILLAVLLRRFFQRSAIRVMPVADRSALRAATYAAAANWLTMIAGAIVLSIVMDQLFMGIPLLFKIWLVLPIVATLAGFYLLYRTIGVWKQGLLGGKFARIRYTLVTLSALFMCWFYYFWNILGFQYY